MKILHIINNLAIGGAEKLVVETLPLYNKRDLKVDLLVFNGTESSFLKELKGKNCCTIYNLGKGSVYNPLLIFKIIPYLKKYDIAHVHLFPALYFVALAKLFSKTKTRLVFTEHSTSNTRVNTKILHIFDRYVYKQYTKIICITKNIKEVFQEYLKLGESKFVVIENGVFIDKFINATPINEGFLLETDLKNDKLLLQVASFQEPKDQQTVIKALRYMSKHVKLLLVGEGVLKKECEELVKKLKLQDRVFFLGLRMDVPQLLKTADIIVLSSKYEGLSLASIEGMASGKPFIASNVPGLSEIVGGAGLLFEVGNEKDLAAKINHLLDNENLYKKTVNNCLNRAAQYDIRYMVEQHIKLYKSLL